jgi:tetratricopeptide (TPR) repeat protein
MEEHGDSGQEIKLGLKLAMDLLLEVEEAIHSEQLPDLLSSGNTDSLSGTATKMRSLAQANRLAKGLDRKIQEVIDRCTGIARNDPSVSLEDGTTPAEVQARALLAKASLLMVLIPAMNLFKRKKKHREAADILQQSIRTFPNQGTYLTLGICLSQLKQRDAAAEAYRNCIDLDPDSEHALEAARELRELGLF